MANVYIYFFHEWAASVLPMDIPIAVLPQVLLDWTPLLSAQSGGKATLRFAHSKWWLPHQAQLHQASLRCVLDEVLVGVWSDNLLASRNGRSECELGNVLRQKFYEQMVFTCSVWMSRVNQWAHTERLVDKQFLPHFILFSKGRQNTDK